MGIQNGVPSFNLIMSEDSSVWSAHCSFAGPESGECWRSKSLETSSLHATLLLDILHGESAT